MGIKVHPESRSVDEQFTAAGPLDWMSEGVCASVDGEKWFPDRGDVKTVAEAKAECRSCPVVAVCAEYALTNDERYGVWGALSERDRDRLRRGAA